MPLATAEASHGFADLEPIGAIVGNAHVVALGEATMAHHLEQHGQRDLEGNAWACDEHVGLRGSCDRGQDSEAVATERQERDRPKRAARGFAKRHPVHRSVEVARHLDHPRAADGRRDVLLEHGQCSLGRRGDHVVARLLHQPQRRRHGDAHAAAGHGAHVRIDLHGPPRCHACTDDRENEQTAAHGVLTALHSTALPRFWDRRARASAVPPSRRVYARIASALVFGSKAWIHLAHQS
ncbi:MAG TPA: hypothetical protein VFQ65_12160, partial [Kofleriaceae bacterium]|nr:hypothetical protein [Kofleriaceae bacterium]